MQSKVFIGRDKELEFFQAELSESDQFRDPVRIFYLRGQGGAGKRTFYDHLGSKLKSGPLNVLWIRPAALAKSDPSSWADVITASMETTKEMVAEPWQAFRAEWSQARAGLVSAGGGGINDSAMVSWLEIFSRHFLSRPKLLKNGSKLRLFFVLDDYDRFSADAKRWFSHSVFEPIVANMPDVDARFLLSGRQSFFDSLDLESYWVPFQNEVKEVDLPAFSPNETARMALAIGFTPPDGFDLHEKSGGIPGKILELASTGLPSLANAPESRLSKDVEALFKGRNEERRNWILGAVHLRVFNDESLNIFGTTEGARKALSWLRKEDALKVVPHGEGYRMDEHWANAILRWQEQTDPEQYRKFASRVEQFREVVQNIPRAEDRRQLAKLSIFNFFNADLLSRVYEEDGEALMRFVHGKIDYFIKTPFNYQVSIKYQPFVQTYARLIPIDDRQRLREKASYIWEKRRGEAEEELGKIREKLTKERDRFTENQKLLDPVIRQVKHREKIIQKARRTEARVVRGKPSKQNLPEPKQPKLTCFFLKLLGISLMGFGLMAADPISWSYLLFGVVFLIFGLFWPAIEDESAKAAAQPRRGIELTERAAEDVSGDTLISLLNLKRTGLENRSSFLSMNLAKFQRRLRELDTIITEPFV